MFASRIRSSDGFIVFVVGVAVFTDMMLYGLVVPILPYALSDRVGIPQEDVQKWNSILLGSFGGALTIGSCDRVRSRQTPFLFGLIALFSSTLALSLTHSITILLLTRIFQGLSAAAVYTVGYAILFDVVGSEKIGQAMGFVGMCQSFGLLVGPAVGGLLYEWGGYFNTFIPAFVLIAVEIALRALVIVRKDRRGKIILTSGQEEEASEAPLLPPETIKKPPYGADSADVDTPEQKLSTFSTLHLLLSQPRIPLALLALFTLNTILTAYDATLPVHISTKFAYPASYASCLFLIMVMPFSLSPLAGYVVDHHGGTKVPATVGWLIFLPTIIVLGTVDEGAAHPFLTLALCLSTLGLGSAVCIPALMAEVSLIVESIERQRPGVFGEKG
ncbi:MAG: hypothetical protein L6R39_005843, partial [Caloplaca ligustica]